MKEMQIYEASVNYPHSIVSRGLITFQVVTGVIVGLKLCTCCAFFRFFFFLNQ